MSVEYNDIELDLIIKDMTKHIDFDISEYESSMDTMRKVEKTYWQYCCHQPYYPRHTFSQYFKRVCNIFNEEWNYLKNNELNKVRGDEISMIFQNPSTHLDPLMTIGDQIAESFIVRQKITKKIFLLQAQ